MKIRVVRSSDNGKNKITGGIIIAIVFGLATVCCVLSGNLDDLFGFAILFTLIAMGGIGLLVKGLQLRNQAKNPPHPIHDFDTDAPEFVQERLNELMFEGRGESKTFSKTVKRVTYTGPDGVTHTTETVTENGDGGTRQKPRHAGSVTCEACGGINKLRRGQHGVCEYCGSHIEG